MADLLLAFGVGILTMLGAAMAYPRRLRVRSWAFLRATTAVGVAFHLGLVLLQSGQP